MCQLWCVFSEKWCVFSHVKCVVGILCGNCLREFWSMEEFPQKIFIVPVTSVFVPAPMQNSKLFRPADCKQTSALHLAGEGRLVVPHRSKVFSIVDSSPLQSFPVRIVTTCRVSSIPDCRVHYGIQCGRTECFS